MDNNWGPKPKMIWPLCWINIENLISVRLEFGFVSALLNHNSPLTSRKQNLYEWFLPTWFANPCVKSTLMNPCVEMRGSIDLPVYRTWEKWLCILYQQNSMYSKSSSTWNHTYHYIIHNNSGEGRECKSWVIVKSLFYQRFTSMTSILAQGS